MSKYVQKTNFYPSVYVHNQFFDIIWQKYVLKNKNSFQYLESEPLNVLKHGWSKKTSLAQCRRRYPDLWGSLEIYGCKSLQIKCIGNLVVYRTRPNMVGQKKQPWSVPERLSRPLYDLGNLAWQRSRNTMASKTNLCWSRPETLSRPLDKLWNLAWQRSRATMVSKTNLSWSVPETLSRPL